MTLHYVSTFSGIASTVAPPFPLFCMRCFNSSHCASHFGPLCNGKGEMHGFVPYKAEYAIAAWSREGRGTLSRTVRGKQDNNPKTKTT